MGVSTLASGQSSFAMGDRAQATGISAVALGELTQALGNGAFAAGASSSAGALGAVAIGNQTTASATGSTAIGLLSQASGNGSVAIGLAPQASQLGAVAIGVDVVASGVQSLALGSQASTNGLNGAIVIGDNSTATLLEATAANQFNVRADGGYRLFSNAAMTAGVQLTAGSGTWASLSDRNAKQNFRSLNGDQVLSRIRTMPIEEWSYITEDSQVRHVGPTAQDFRAAFGLGTSDRTITTIDIDGINLFAIQQLIERSESLKAENAALRNEVNDLKTRIERLERLVDRR